ncbi:MAG TPA: cobalamin B12-binding domain-containing protein [Pseudomonadales bacterium]
MANIAIIRLIYGMTLCPAQLAGELLAAGHTPLVIFFKRMDALDINADDSAYARGDVPLISYIVNSKGAQTVRMGQWRTTTANELKHLVTRLKEFEPDAIGISCLSEAMTLAGEVTEHLRQYFDVPILWGGTGPTLEAERSIAHADLVCVGEGEDVIREIGARLDAKQSLADIDGTWFKLPDQSIQKTQSAQYPTLKPLPYQHGNPSITR